MGSNGLNFETLETVTAAAVLVLMLVNCWLMVLVYLAGRRQPMKPSLRPYDKTMTIIVALMTAFAIWAGYYAFKLRAPRPPPPDDIRRVYR